MKAFLLAAGLGVRLRPITNQLPKCLVPIGSQPLLQIWLELLASHGVEEVLINTHYLRERVLEFVAGWSEAPRIHLAHEEVLLGSAGTLDKNWDFVADEEDFLVCYADNLTDINLGELIHFHRGHQGLATLTLFKPERPGECGIVEVDEKGLILSFEEKPSHPKSSLANGGIYVMRNGVQRLLPPQKPADIGFDLLPRCLGKMYGWPWRGLLIDIGNLDAYAKAQRRWSERPQ